MPNQPKWILPERQAYLLKLFQQSDKPNLYGFCIYGLSPCKGHFESKTKTTIIIPKLNDATGLTGKPIHITTKTDYWHCDYGDYPCYSCRAVQGLNGNTEMLGESQYQEYIKRIIREWGNDSRLDTQGEWKAEQKAIHKTNSRTYPLHGRFNAVSRDIYHDAQPVFYLDTIGMSGLTFKPFARLRIASMNVILHVTIDTAFKPVKLSKNRKRKAIRYGKIPLDVQNSIYDVCWQAVKSLDNF